MKKTTMKKRIGGLCLVILQVLLLLMASSPMIKAEANNGVWTGNGEYDDPYLIEDLADLLEFREYVNAGRSTEDQYFQLKNDLDLQEVCGESIGSWTPIGTQSHPFKGHFSGSEKKIRNLYISGGNNVGLFGVNEGYIDSVIVYGYVSGDENVAGVVGENRFSVSSCWSDVDLTGKSRVGGIAGCNRGFIFDCCNKGTVVATVEEAGGIAGFSSDSIDFCTNSGFVAGAGRVGGIAGYSKARIADCITEMSYEISAIENDDGQDQDIYIGGIVGLTDSYVERCTNRSRILGTKSVVGGIAGKATGEWVCNCINEGEVSGGGTIGGIVGWFQGKEGQNNNRIIKCSNSGKITGTENRVGGIVGTASFCDITECVNRGNVEGKESTGGIAGSFADIGNFANVTNHGKVQGENYTGGIAGKMDKKGSVCNCVNNGVVEGKDCTGGIVGGDPDETTVSRPGKFVECMNTAAVTGKTKTGGIAGQCGRIVNDSINKGEVKGTSAVAGIVGKTLSGISIENNVNTGNISGTADSVGGIAGDNKNIPIRECRNEGRVDGSKYVGGIAGDNRGSYGNLRGVIEGCQNSGEIRGTGEDHTGGIAGICSYADITGCENSGDISSGRDYTGGITGSGVNVKIRRCGNTGSVISKQKYVGGIGGRIEDSEVEDCYDRGMVTGGYDVGGIVGCVAGTEDLIARCYVKAGRNNIRRDIDSENGCVGALYGKRESMTNVTMEFCYWWRSCAQKARGDIEGADESDPSLGFTAYSDERWFGISSKFTSWDFGNVWKISDGVPELDNQYDISVSDSIGFDDAMYVTGGEGCHYARLSYIHSLDDLEAFRDAVNSGDSYLGAAVFLCTDLDLGGDSGRNWRPIGQELSMKFSGSFYGGNHVIKGLSVSATDIAGLFGCCSGTIRDLAVIGTVTGNGNWVGGITGNCEGLIKNCFFLGDVTSNGQGSDVGGIAGFVTGYGVMEDCGHVGSVLVKKGYAGGVVGMQRAKTFCIYRCFHYNKFDLKRNVVSEVSGKAGSVIGEAINPSALSDNYAIAGCCTRCIGYTPESSQSGVSGGTMLDVEDFRKPEMFTNWNIDSDENSYWIMGQDYPITRSLSACMILSPNGAEGEEQKLCEIKGQLKAPGAIYTREGYIFTGWNDEADGSGSIYYEGDDVPGGTTLYAQWLEGVPYRKYMPIEPADPDEIGIEDHTYDLLLDGNEDTKWCLETSGSDDTWTLEFNTKEYVRPYAYALVTAGDTKMYPGRNPKNWTLEALDASGRWTVLDEVTNDGTLPPRNNCAVYKQFKNNMEYCHFRITFKGLTSGKVFQLSEFFLITKDPKKDVRKAKITLHACSSIQDAAIKREYVWGEIGTKVYIPTDPWGEECYELLYWTEKPNGEGKVYKFGDPYIIERDITIYARWKIRDFQLVVKRDADEEPPYFRNYWTYNANRPFKLKPPAREGYLFQYWIVTSPAGNWKPGATYDKDTLFSGMYGNAELVGIWKEIREVSVKWYCGSKLMDEGTYYEGDTPTYNGEQPQKESDPEYDYVFKGWDKEIKPLTGDTTYHAEFTENRRSYDITWLNEKGEQIDVTSVEYGTVPTHEDLGKLPTKESCFIFDGWDKTPVAVTGKATYKAKFREVPRPYEITWQYDDGTVIDVTEVDYGSVPSHAEPEMMPTDEYTYTFAGWDRQPTVVDGPAVYTAQFTASKNSYEITWKNDNGEVIDVTTAEYGEIPTHEVPSKKGDEQFGYTFSGWSPSVKAVTGAAEYTAQFSRTINSYEIVWKDENGAVIDTTKVEYGSMPLHEDLSKKETKEFSYEFDGWEPELKAVDGPAEYQAIFRENKKSYEIVWKYESGRVIDTKTLEYGTLPSCEAPSMEATAEFEYAFDGWDPEIIKVDGPAVYTAKFTATRRSYEITWQDDEGNVFDTTVAEYGSVPSHEDPVKKETDEFTYSFKGWNRDFKAVEGPETYVARFDKTKRSYEITWKMDDGSVIDVTTLEYGATPTHDDPVKEATEEYTYTFAGWDKEVAAVTGAAEYKALFTASKNSYEITWKNDDDSVIDVTTVEYGEMPTHEDPVKEATVEYTYTFAGWDKEVAAVTGAAEYKALFTASKNSYEITWKNDDDSVIDVTTVEYGETPTHEKPMKETTAEYTYEFAGWSPEVTAVEGATEYKANFTATRRSYEITWKDDHDNVIEVTKVEYGTVPKHAAPVRETTAEYTYTFTGWSPEITAVTGPAEYRANITSARRSYEVTWLDDDGSVIDVTTLEYGVTPTHEDPVKEATVEYTYTFAGWDKEVAAVTGAAEYKAQFTASKNSYEITWKNDDGSVIDVTKVEYGATPIHEDPVKEATDEYTYEFAGWDKEVAAVTGPAEYIAKFTAVKRSYEITWKMDDGSVIDVTKAEYGTVPEHAKAQKKATDEYTYEFAGWDKEVAAVTGPAEYIAKFTEKKINSENAEAQTSVTDNTNSSSEPVPQPIKKFYKITWKYEDGTKIDVTKVEEGMVPVHADPVMKATAEYTYEFIGWDREPAKVSGPATYTAMFRRIRNVYSVRFESNGGTASAVLTAEYGDHINRPAEPEREGYTFEGWYTDEALTQEYNFNEPVVADITVYAKWKLEEKPVTEVKETKAPPKEATIETVAPTTAPVAQETTLASETTEALLLETDGLNIPAILAIIIAALAGLTAVGALTIILRNRLGKK